MTKTVDRFSLQDRVAVITGGGGLMGGEHALAMAECGARPVLWDINAEAVKAKADKVILETGVEAVAAKVDITSQEAVQAAFRDVLGRFGRVDILINNAANDPKVDPKADPSWSRLENFPLAAWNADIAVGLTGALICSQVIGSHMAANAGGVIVNVASDLAVIAPDQRLYRRPDLPDARQPAKPVSYSVVKHGLVGLTKYLAGYWATRNVRVNAISPGGIYTGQPDEFVERLTSLIPMGRMANRDEYRAAMVFLCSDASAYMTGQNLVIEGGRTVL